MNRFELLLQDLSEELSLSLTQDKHRACSILLQETTVQLQLDSSEEHLYLFSKLGEVPPGRFRENVLKEALLSNGIFPARPGVLGYILSQNTLALSRKHPLHHLTPPQLAALFYEFHHMAQEWKKALSKGLPSPSSL